MEGGSAVKCGWVMYGVCKKDVFGIPTTME